MRSTPGWILIVQHFSYALFPAVTKGGLVVGGARGQGVVYAQGRHVGYCDLTQGSVGAQAGARCRQAPIQPPLHQADAEGVLALG